MAADGYISCSGCGRLFKQDDPQELQALEDHDCEADEDICPWANTPAEECLAIVLDEHKTAEDQAAHIAWHCEWAVRHNKFVRHDDGSYSLKETWN